MSPPCLIPTSLDVPHHVELEVLNHILDKFPVASNISFVLLKAVKLEVAPLRLSDDLFPFPNASFPVSASP